MKLNGMKKKPTNSGISPELLAAYLDGNATSGECQTVLEALSRDAGLREIMRISGSVDRELGMIPEEIETLPMTAMAATCDSTAFCCLECEKYVLDRRGIPYDGKRLLENAVRKGWQKDGGTALHNVGRHLESSGLAVIRRYKCTLQDISDALEAGDDVIVAIDGGELLGDRALEYHEDMTAGQVPDHTVVVLSIDISAGTVTVHDPDSLNAEDVYPAGQFADAWADSKNYMVTITSKDMKKAYIPEPIDLSDVELTEDLHDLREAIAENAHDIWAESRQAEGWTYGPQRNDELKQTPDMVPYSQLPESEKEYDREMAMKTIKLLKKLGYDLVRREETELYRVLKQRIQDSGQEFYCRRCGNVIYRHQVFCDRCGLELKMDWSDYD